MSDEEKHCKYFEPLENGQQNPTPTKEEAIELLKELAEREIEYKEKLKKAKEFIEFSNSEGFEDTFIRLMQEENTADKTFNTIEEAKAWPKKFYEDMKQNLHLIEMQRLYITEVLEDYKKHPNFYKLHQGEATNRLARIKARLNDPAQLDLYGNGIITDKDFKLFINKYRELTNGVGPTAKLLLDSLVITATESGQSDTLTRLPLSKYMEMRELKDVKEARKQVKEDLEALYNISISFKEKRNSDMQDYLDMRICDSKGISKGIIHFNFSDPFYNILKHYPIMPYPKEILKINPKHNPNTYNLYRRIAEHKNMNWGKSNADIISVKTLLAAAQELPSYEMVMATTRQVDKRIIQPFERDLDAIRGLTWEYIGKNEAQAEPPLSYEEFINLNVKITWINYPDQTERIKKNKARKIKTQKKGG